MNTITEIIVAALDSESENPTHTHTNFVGEDENGKPIKEVNHHELTREGAIKLLDQHFQGSVNSVFYNYGTEVEDDGN